MCKLACVLWLYCLLVSARSLQEQRVGGLTEVYAWKQITYNIEGTVLTRDRASASGLGGERRNKRQSDFVFLDRDDDYDRDSRITRFPSPHHNYNYQGYNFSNNRIDTPTPRPTNTDEPSTFFIQYNNVPMGAEKVGHRLFVTLPRRRYGIPSTLNYVDLRTDVDRSPHLRPYPNLRESRDLVSVYRTRADECGRLWMVDTGLLEIPDQPQQVQPPAIVVYDLTTNMQILRYQFKESHLPANNTPTGLASITVDTSTGCSDTFAYIPDLTTFGIIVFSLRQRDSWRVTHSYMHFNPLAVNLNIAGQTFQWSDGIFSITLGRGRCAPAYFHPLISWQEFSVNSCVLRNSTAASDSNYWTSYSLVGERGPNSQSTMHDIHKQSGVIFFAEVGKNSMSCWDSNRPLSPDNVAVLATDQNRLSYPADLHVSDQQVWLIANKLPRYSYSSLNTNEYNFFVYKANVEELIYGTVCSSRTHPAGYSNTRDSVY